jgi:hypothetical protein
VGGVMAGSIRISKPLIMFFLFSTLHLTTLVQQVSALGCKEIAKKLIVDDKKVYKIQAQMIHAIGGSESKIPHPSVDRFNRHVNILIHNLGSRVNRMRGLLEDAKQKGNTCQKMASKLSGMLDDMQDIYVKMGKSLENPKTAERELFELSKNLKTKANNAKSELQSVAQ